MAAIPSSPAAQQPIVRLDGNAPGRKIEGKVLNLEYGGRRFTVERLPNKLTLVKTKGPTSQEVKVQLKFKDSGSLTDKQIIALVSNEFENNAGQGPLKEFLAASGLRAKATIPATATVAAKGPTKTAVKFEVITTPNGAVIEKLSFARPLGDRFTVVASVNSNLAVSGIINKDIPTSKDVNVGLYGGVVGNLKNGKVIPLVGLNVSTNIALNETLNANLGFNNEWALIGDKVVYDPSIGLSLSQKLGNGVKGTLGVDAGPNGFTFRAGIGSVF